MRIPAAEFVESWIDHNVTYVDQGGDSTRAATLADMCRQAAAAIGISVDDIHPEFGPLESIILEAMNYAVGTPND